MLFDDDTEHEPDPEPDPEPEPEARFPDPERELPDVPSLEDVDVPGEVAVSFWALVLVANAVVLAVGVGLMLIGFRGDWETGGRLLAAGAILSVYGYYRYRVGTFEVDGDRQAVVDDAETEVDADRRPPAGTVADEEGNRYVLEKRSEGASLVRDPETGDRQYLSNERIEATGDPPLATVAREVPDATRRVLSAAHDDRSLGLLIEVVERGPVAVRDLLADYDLCESDLHGLLGEFRAAGLLEETTVAGERGYEATDVAVEGVEHLRRSGDGQF